ncbi:MAG: hypothetical protein AB7D37_18465 [Desulfovibrio sp.]
MESAKPVTLIELSRQERLMVVMGRLDLTFRKLGELAGITGLNAAKHLKSESIPPHHHAIWAQVLPEDVLPPAVHHKPGPKPRAENRAV